jgi:hypothetical protein
MTIATTLPEGFVYPVGYRPTSPRILDSGILEGFKPFEFPYIVTCCNGQPGVDPNAPTAVARLRHGKCPRLSSLIRYLELGGDPDEAMQATYSCEDTLTTACDYSEAGFHQTGIEIIRSLPKPFQQSGPALKALVESLMALSRYEEALQEVRLLIASRAAPTEWVLTLHRLEEVQLLMILGKLEEAEKIMAQRRVEFQDKYQYYGSRAALALLRGEEVLARSLVVKAGRVDPFHCYKILWNPLLKPIEAFIRKELLTEQGEPLVYQRDVEMRKISNGVQGALLLGERDRAANLAEGLILDRVTSWSTAEEAMLALVGIGHFEAIHGIANLVPAGSHQWKSLARQVARAITTGNESDISGVGKLADKMDCKNQTKELLIQATRELAVGKTFSLPANFETLLVEVGDAWREDDRDLFNIHCIGGRFVLTKMSEPRQRRSEELRNRDLRKVFPVIETSEFSGSDEVARWIEEKLTANRSYIPNNAYRAPFMVNIDGWTLISSLKPSDATPLVREAWESACNDPNFYFQNGPASSFGMHASYAIRLLTMLARAHEAK